MSSNIKFTNSSGVTQIFTGINKVTFDTEEGGTVEFSEGGGGIDPSDATATASDILAPKTAYIADGSKATGTITSKSAETFTPTTSDQIISSGQYLAGAQTINGDANLVANNILNGTSIFGVAGTVRKAATTVTNIDSTTTTEYFSGTNPITTYAVYFDGGFYITTCNWMKSGDGRYYGTTAPWSENVFHYKYYGYLCDAKRNGTQIGFPVISSGNYQVRYAGYY